MKKKITAIFLCVALLATAIVGASLAYFTDTDNETNTFTVGNVKIDLIEEERDGKGGKQEFTQDKYFHSRPSAADYNGAGAVGSNLTPTSPKITERAREIIKKYGATAGNPIPADMVTASGSGLDPHITLAAAKFQAPRVAKARGISEAELEKIIASQVEYPGGVMRNEPIVNVLMLNLALDRKR